MKTVLKILLVGIIAFSSTAWAKSKISWEGVNNHYRIYLPMGDKASMDFYRDGTLILMPYTTNKELVHICWGNWNYDEKKASIKISKASRCTILNGTYQISRMRGGFKLTEGNKVLNLQYMHDLKLAN